MKTQGIFKTAMAATALSCVLAGTDVHAADIVIGTYQLSSHPGGNQNPPPYGFRLDELINFTSGHDVITFDFDAPGANMQMTYDGTSIHIFGIAFGGLDTGGAYSANAAHTSFVEIDFTYNPMTLVGGDDDLQFIGPDFANSGTITWLDTGDVFDLWDVGSGMHGYTFQLGDETNDAGHRGFDGISGWGWVNHAPAGTDPNDTTHVYASDWLFTATLIPVPPAVYLGCAGLLGMVLLRRRIV